MDTSDDKSRKNLGNYSKDQLVSDLKKAVNIEKELSEDSSFSNSKIDKDKIAAKLIDALSKAIDDLDNINDSIVTELNRVEPSAIPEVVRRIGGIRHNLGNIKNIIAGFEAGHAGQIVSPEDIQGLSEGLSSVLEDLSGIQESLSAPAAQGTTTQGAPAAQGANTQGSAAQGVTGGTGTSDGTGDGGSTDQTDTSRLNLLSTRVNLFITNINSIKEGLVLLFINPETKVYFDYCIDPLLNILYDLSTTSLNLSTTTNFLASSCVVCAKHSKLKDTLHLVYCINDECEDVFKALKRRIDLIIQFTC